MFKTMIAVLPEVFFLTDWFQILERKLDWNFEVMQESPLSALIILWWTLSGNQLLLTGLFNNLY